MTSPETRTGGAQLAQTLKAYGVDHIFFVDAILRHMLAHAEQQGIRRILAHSEKAAAYMADGYARGSGRPAVCMAQSVGAANLASGLQDARFAGSPVIALTGRHVAEKQYRHAYQELPHEPMFATVTKFSGRIETPFQLGHLVRHAFRVATSGATGPVHLDVSGHAGNVNDDWKFTEDIVSEDAHTRVPAHRPRPDAASIAALARALDSAQSPVIVVGQEACWSGAGPALVALARRQQIPIACGLDAKAMMAELPELDAGVAGTYGTDAANKLIAEADFVAFIGSDVGDQITSNWKLPLPGVRTAQVGIDAADLGSNLPGALTVHADTRVALEELDALMQPRVRGNWLARMHEMKEQWRAEHAAQCASDAALVRPERLISELGRWLPEQATVVADTGFASQWCAQFLQLRHSGQQFLRAVGSLGWAFPASLGVKCAQPHRPVVCFTGDGGFMYHLPELETARRWSLKTITVVNNNGCLGQGQRSLQAVQIGGSGMADCYKFVQQDFAAIAQAMGCTGIRVRHSNELAGAFEEALRADGPVVIDVRSDPAAMCKTPWMPA
ncbi:MAG: thiamine pyrophosphate-binding protein [Pseudomonadota bacterium]